jgi:hypothetical protein
MRKLGILAVAMGIAFGMAVATLSIHSMPDIKRYLKIRSM